MTAALLFASGALLLWPGGRRRVLPVRGDSSGGPGWPEATVPVVLAVAVGALVGTPLVAALAGAAALGGVRAWAARAEERRGEVRLRSLADGLGAFAADLRSGRSLDAATAAAGAACGDAATGELLVRVLRAPGAPLPDDPGLGDAPGRIAAAARLSSRTGCSLAAVVTALEDDLRARIGHRAELRAATAGPRASALVLAGLPLFGLAMGSGVGADPWGVLTTTGTGQVLLVVGFALEVVGLIWAHRLIRRAVP